MSTLGSLGLAEPYIGTLSTRTNASTNENPKRNGCTQKGFVQASVHRLLLRNPRFLLWADLFPFQEHRPSLRRCPFHVTQKCRSWSSCLNCTAPRAPESWIDNASSWMEIASDCVRNHLNPLMVRKGSPEQTAPKFEDHLHISDETTVSQSLGRCEHWQ